MRSSTGFTLSESNSCFDRQSRNSDKSLQTHIHRPTSPVNPELLSLEMQTATSDECIWPRGKWTCHKPLARPLTNGQRDSQWNLLLSALCCSYSSLFHRQLSTFSFFNEKKCSERRKHCTLAVVRQSQILPTARPLPGGAGRSKSNQLEMVTTFTYRPSLVKIGACNFELSW